MNHRLTTILLAVNVLLALVLALLWFGAGASQRTQWVAPPPLAPSLEASTAALLVSHPNINSNDNAPLERPLFALNRRPPVPEATASDPVAPPPSPDLLDKTQLRGIVRGPALNGVLAEVEGKQRFVRRGEALGEWTLQSVREREVTFGNGAEHRIVVLPLAMASAPGTAGAQRPQPVSGGKPPPRAAPIERSAPR